ncbi:AraC family transcriptional regulator [Streptomyces sp. JJ36]|uniref:AraC family transcriptional regulator n=1 Tax=Streptomyces sp. JJ36 TaxID=2736645 RepID=UPI001F3BAC2F|nr:AraC family transcriptional regulator [Streptomyces sp. JJ36]MCF6523416.1 AraC family transcriptional regulator [Streptomyces sp. JJ36]
MDTLTGLLEGPRARGAFLLTSVLAPPWSLRIEDRAPVSVVTPARGTAWMLPDHGTPVLLHPGDVAVVRGPDPYTLADRPGTPVQITVGPDQRCSTAGGEDVTETRALGVRTWGDASGPDAAVLLSGTYRTPSAVGRRLLATMPALLVRPASGHDALVTMLAEEIGREEPAQGLVLDRLLDLLLIDVVRAWLATPGAGAPAWYGAQSDPLVGPALRLLHEHPAHPWTVASLAARVGTSRAGLARRFTALTGEPPMAYLTAWRMARAADLLHEPGATVASVARQVGYGSAFALSAAFKRIHGVSPREYREGGGDAPPCPAPVTATPRTVVL